MFQDIIAESQFFPLVFTFQICGFDIYGTLVARINSIYRGLPVYRKNPGKSELSRIHDRWQERPTHVPEHQIFILRKEYKIGKIKRHDSPKF
jgi:hypothetical protein